jgi:hypothetical protein
MLDNFMLCIVFGRDNCKTMHLMQGGAQSYFALPVRAWRNNHFAGRWIGRGGRRDDHVGLGVEDHGLGMEDDKDEHLKIISFCGVGLKLGVLIKTNNAC